MASFSNIHEKLKDLPWRSSLGVLGVSFVCASILSTIIAQIFLAEVNGPGGQKPGGLNGVNNSSFNVPNSASSLNDAALKTILQRNIFNSEGAVGDQEEKPEDQPQTTEAVKTDLPIKLLGTIYGGDPYSGIAIIENTGKHSINSFMVGDALAKDATIKEVRRERILIDRMGRLEFADVERPEAPKGRREKRVAKPAAPTGISPIATEPPPPAFKEEGFERKGTEISMAQTYRNKLLTSDFTKVLQDAKASPNMVGGELKGFLLTRIRKDSIYEKAGLQNNDIIEEVNGVPLTDVAQAIKLLNSLRNESRIDVRLNRGGSPMTVTLSVQQ